MQRQFEALLDDSEVDFMTAGQFKKHLQKALAKSKQLKPPEEEIEDYIKQIVNANIGIGPQKAIIGPDGKVINTEKRIPLCKRKVLQQAMIN